MTKSKDGTSFRTENESLMLILDTLRKSKQRVRVIYDGPHGKYGENFDLGYVGRTMGNPQAPGGGSKCSILLYNSRSRGGFILEDDHIIRIEASNGGGLIWPRPWHQPKDAVQADGE